MKRSIINMFVVMAAVLPLVTLNSCSPEKPDELPHGSTTEPPIASYTVFSFKESSYAENLWAVNESAYYGSLYTRDSFVVWDCHDPRIVESFMSGEEMYLLLHDNLLICNYTVMIPIAVVLKEKENGHEINKWCYGYEDVLDFHPFSSFYCIPGKAIGINHYWEQEEMSKNERLRRINALIDDGSIEQYRVDLGY